MSTMTQNNFDRTPFFGTKICPELKFLQQVLNNKIPTVNVPKNCFRELLKITIQSFDCENVENSRHLDEKIQAIVTHFQITEPDVILSLTSLIKLLKFSMKISSIKQEIVKEDLVDFLKIPSDYATDFVNLLYGPKRVNVEHIFVSSCPKNVYPTSIKWRVDVSLSTSSLNRTLDPIVKMQFNLSSGKKVSFDMSLQTFHQLRFNVALILKEMDDIMTKQPFK